MLTVLLSIQILAFIVLKTRMLCWPPYHHSVIVTTKLMLLCVIKNAILVIVGKQPCVSKIVLNRWEMMVSIAPNHKCNHMEEALDSHNKVVTLIIWLQVVRSGVYYGILNVNLATTILRVVSVQWTVRMACKTLAYLVKRIFMIVEWVICLCVKMLKLWLIGCAMKVAKQITKWMQVFAGKTVQALRQILEWAVKKPHMTVESENYHSANLVKI